MNDQDLELATTIGRDISKYYCILAKAVFYISLDASLGKVLAFYLAFKSLAS